jgi:ABC exporter DevB family membrane fusion protein
MKSDSLFKPLGLKPTLLIISAVVGTIIGTTWYALKTQTSTQDTVAASSTSPTLTSVAALGYLQTKDDAIELSAPAFQEGARISKLLVQQRDKVKIGQVIAILDSRDRLQAALEEAQKQVKVAEARLLQVQAGAKKGDIQAQNARFQSTKAELEGQINTQKATIANLEAQLEGQTNAQKATIERLKAQLNNATKECQRYDFLYADGAVSSSRRDSFCLQQETNQKQLKEAEANLTRIVNTLQQQINEARANLERTITTLERQIAEAQASLESVAEVRLVDVRVAQTELETARATVARAKANLDLAYVKSSINGQILKINTWPGEIVNNTEGIVIVGDTENMYAVAEVYETDINRVRIGQLATIDTDGITKNLTGIVDDIGLEIGTKDVLGTDPVADADARVVQVKIRLRPEDSKLVANLTNLKVNVIINTQDSLKQEIN